MRHLLLVIALVFAGLAPTLAAAPATFDTPTALVDALYAPYLKADFDWNSFDEASFRSKALDALFDKDAKRPMARSAGSTSIPSRRPGLPDHGLEDRHAHDHG